MAGQADGSVYINTELDPEGFKAGSEQLKSAIKSLNTKVKELGPALKQAVKGNVGAMQDFKSRASELKSSIAEIESEMEALGNKPIATEQYASLTKSMDEAVYKLQALEQKQKEMKAQGVSQNSAKWQRLQAQIDEATRKVDTYQTACQNLEDNGQAFTPGSSTAAYGQLAEQLAAAKSQLADMEAKAAAVEKKAHGIGAAFKKIGKAVGTAAKTVGGALLNGLKGALSATKKLVTGNRDYKKSFSGMFSSIKKISLGLLGVRAVYGILRKAVSAYMDANQGLANQLSSCWTSLGNLLGPIITKIINLVSTAISYVTAFLKLLGMTGSAATDAVEGAGGAAEKAQKSLTGFDEINALQDSSSSGGGGGSSSSSALPDVTLPDWAQLMVEQIKAGNWAAAATTLTTELNSMIASVDWAGIGDKIGYFLNGALTFLATAILTFDWVALGSDLATSLNGIITGVDWGNLAVILSAKLLILLQTLTGFFETLDGAAFGNAIHQFISGGINSVDWVGATGRLSKAISDFIMAIDFEQIGTDLSNAFKTVLESISSAIENFDWGGLGSQIAGFINGIDWGGIIADCVTLIGDVVDGALDLLIDFAEKTDWSKLGNDLWTGLESIVTNINWSGLVSKAFELLGAAIGGAAQLIWTILQNLWELLCQGWDDTKSYFTQHIEDAGGDIIQGLWNGIVEALANVGNWIVENIWNPFIEGFKNAFGIHSPSTKMAEMGGYIIEGLLNGITEAWNMITEFFSNALASIGEAISNAWNSVVSWTETAWSNVKTTVGNAWENVKQTTSTVCSAIGNGVSSAWNSVKSWTSNAWSNVKSTVSSAWSSVKSTASAGYNAVKSGVSTAWNSIKSATSSTWSSIKSSLSSSWSNIKSVASSGYNAVKSGISSAWNSIKSSTSSTWSNIKNTIKNQGWSGLGNNICSGISSGIDSGWSWLKNKVSNLASNLLSAAKNALGIHSPSRLFRDAVGLNIGYGIGVGIENSEGSILDSVSGVANAIAEEFNAGDYKTGNLIPTAEIDGSLTSFSDTITDSFTALLAKLDAIAQRLTFTVPAFAGSVVPYKATTAGNSQRSSGTDDSNEDLTRTMESTSNRQLALLREQNNLLRQLLDKDTNVTAVIGTSDVVDGLARKNRRDGKTVVPVGA